MEDIAVECHFPHIGSHVGDPGLGHAVSDQRLLLRRHHHMKMDRAPPLFCQRSSRSRLRRLGGCSRTLSSGFSDRGDTGRLLMMPSIIFPFCSIASSAFLLGLCSCSINILLSVAPVRGVFLWDGLPPVSLGLLCGGFHLLPNGTGSVGIVGRRPQLIVRRLPLRQWPCVGQMSPRQKRPIFNRDALIVVDNFIRGVAGRLGKCPNVHGALGGVQRRLKPETYLHYNNQRY